MEDEVVAVVRQVPAEERGLRLDDGLRRVEETLHVRVGRAPLGPYGVRVLLAAGDHARLAVMAGLDGRVDEHVVVLRAVAPWVIRQLLERGRDLVGLGDVELDDDRFFERVAHARERRRAVQIHVRGVHVVRAHGELAAVDVITDGDFLGAVVLDAPPVLAGFLHGVRVTRETFDVAGVFADEVAPRRPHREEELERLGQGRFGRNRRLYRDEVRGGVCDGDAVEDAHACILV